MGLVLREEPAPPRPARMSRPRKAELLAEARGLGIEVPEGATNKQIARLIEESGR